MCNLASLALPAFVCDGRYDFQKLHAVTKVVARNLARIIDVNYYPVPEAARSNKRHRPIGIGVQGSRTRSWRSASRSTAQKQEN